MSTLAKNVNKSIFALAAAATSGNTATLDNAFWSGLQLGVNITAITGTTPSLTVIIEGQDDVSGVWYPLLTSAALNATGFTLLTLFPSVTVVANVSASQVLPTTWRVRYVIAGTTPAVTATIGASLQN